MKAQALKRVQVAAVLICALAFAFGSAWAQEEIRITYMQPFPDGMQPLINESIARFEAANPGIKVENIQVPWDQFWDRLAVMLAGAVGPDVLHMVAGFSNDAMAKNLFEDLRPYMERDGVAAGDYWANYELLSMGGRQYGLPYDTSVPLVAFNRELLNAAGLAEPRIGWTWDEYREAASRLTRVDSSGEIVQYGGMGQPLSWVAEAYFRQFGGGMFGKDQTIRLASAETVAAVEHLANLWIEDRTTVPVSLGGQVPGGGFAGGRVGFYFTGTFGLQPLLDIDGLDFGIAPLPLGEHDTTVTMGGGIGVNAASPHVEAAWKFVKYFAGDENLAHLMGVGGYGIPAHRGAVVSYLEYLASHNLNPDVVLSELEKASTLYLPLNWPELDAILSPALEAAYRGDRPVRATLEDIARQWQAIVRWP